MNKWSNRSILVTIMILVFVAVFVAKFTGVNIFNKNKSKGVGYYDYLSPTSLLASYDAEPLSINEVQSLIRVVWAEKLLHDLAYELGERYDLVYMKDIARSEQTHLDAMNSLFVRYELSSRLVGYSRGEYGDAAMKTYYDSLLLKAMESESLALVQMQRGLESDLEILESDRGLIDNKDVGLVYDNLMRGTRNHMRVLHRKMVAMGAKYEPTMVKADYLELVNSPSETNDQE